MSKHLIVWCIEAPQSNFLKEVQYHQGGQRLLFTDRWDDSAMQFATKEQAYSFVELHRLEWLSVTDHMLVNIE